MGLAIFTLIHILISLGATSVTGSFSRFAVSHRLMGWA
jgi:hypothetical protein